MTRSNVMTNSQSSTSFRPACARWPALFLSGFVACSFASHAATPSFKLPEGFVIQPVAAPPQIQFPMFATFDDRGYLYVAESSGLDLYAELQQQTHRCRISRLEDRDGDGAFERAEVFAEQLVFPMGLAWREGKLYAADPPDLATLEDIDGDG